MEIKINSFLKDMHKFSNDKDYFSFFYKTKTHVMVNLTLGSSNKNNFTYEDLCKKLTPKFSSRSTIQSILNEGCSKKYFDKVVNISYKREKYFKLNFLTKKKLEIWVERQKEIFSL